MSRQLSKLYQQTILEHNRNPQNYGKPPSWTHYAEGLNAVCGDLVNVYLTVEKQIIKEIKYDGESCAIAMASASMMTALIKGKTIARSLQLFDLFCRLMDKNNPDQAIAELGEVNNLLTVKQFPSRIKSATLCWHAMAAAINGESSATTE